MTGNPDYDGDGWDWPDEDDWLKLTGRHTLTRQMVDWLRDPTLGPVIIAGVAFLLVLGALHFLRYHASGP